MRRIALLGPAAAGLAFFACSSSSPSSPPADGGAGDAAAEVKLDPLADWSCLGKVKIPAPMSATVHYDLGLVDPFTNAAIKGATVKTCARTDSACASPFETLISDDMGVAAFKSVPTGGAGFDGFFDVQVTNEVPNLNYQGLISAGGSGPFMRAYWGDSQLATLFSSSAITRDPALATLGIQVHDCAETPGGVPCNGPCRSYYPGGVSFTIDVQDPKIVLGYIQSTGGAVVVSTKVNVTSPLVGLAGFLNVPPGPVTVTAKVAATGQTIGSYSMTARAGAMSLLVANAL